MKNQLNAWFLFFLLKKVWKIDEKALTDQLNLYIILNELNLNYLKLFKGIY